ncbi:hypothetical protein JZ751_009487, partial [Albula glossodonta]
MTTEAQCREGEILHEKRCCKLCPKGHYVQSACQGSNPTVCQPCPHGHYTEAANFLFKCLPCRPCHSGSHLMLTGECRADQNRQCKCVEGYFCEDRKCGHCRSVKICPSGSGVTDQPTVWRDTVCNNCPEGTYNNVSDSKTPCQPHTNCEAQGLQFRSHGTRHSDAVCAFIEKEPSAEKNSSSSTTEAIPEVYQPMKSMDLQYLLGYHSLDPHLLQNSQRGER